MFLRSGKAFVDRGVQGYIQTTPLFIYYRPYFQCGSVRRKLLLLKTEFKRNTYPNRPFPLQWRSHAWVDMRTNVSSSAIAAKRIKNIEAGFKPGCPPVRYLYRFVKDVIGGQLPVDNRGAAVKSIVAMQFNHSAATVVGFGTVNLYLIIILGFKRKAG